jgi:hypothetical protein
MIVQPLSNALLLALLLPIELSAFTTSLNSPLTSRTPTCQRTGGFYAATKEEEDVDVVSSSTRVNGTPPSPESSSTEKVIDGQDESLFQDFNASQYTESMMANLTGVMDEISRRINDGSMELFENLTSVMDSKLTGQLPDATVMELSDYISDIAANLQKAQQQELERQLEELEKRLVEPFEQLAFSDAPLFDIDRKRIKTLEEVEREEAERKRAQQRDLVLAGANSTLPRSSRMKTSELVKNFNVAPLYYSAALLYRWARKVSYPSVLLVTTFKGIATVLKTKGGPAKKKNAGEVTYEEYMKDAEAMQSGWKKIGLIAAKGPIAKKWAILRRSAEVWAYFSSFYLKDRRIARKYQKGLWTEAKFKEERSKLGAEITQNLLRLGPTFIKVCTNDHV